MRAMIVINEVEGDKLQIHAHFDPPIPKAAREVDGPVNGMTMRLLELAMMILLSDGPNVIIEAAQAVCPNWMEARKAAGRAVAEGRNIIPEWPNN